jgi:hypothetical protein
MSCVLVGLGFGCGSPLHQHVTMRYTLDTRQHVWRRDCLETRGATTDTRSPDPEGIGTS